MSGPNVFMEIAYASAPDEIAYLPEAKRAEYARKRKFYSCDGKQNYVSYVNDGSKSRLDYVAYSGDGEKSHGLFDQNGLLDKERQAALRDKLRATKSKIWHGFISFPTEFGNRYVNGYEDAYRLMATEFPKFFRMAGLNPDNITWYAGLHENTLHRHIHFSFFENEPQRFTAREHKIAQYSKGRIAESVLARVKVSIEKRLTDITAELKAARKNVTDIMQSVMFTDGHRERLTGEIQERLLALAEALPPDGRLSYASGNMAYLRPEIDRITDLIIRRSPALYGAFNTFCDSAIRRDERAKEMLTSQKIPEKDWAKDLITDKALEDVYRRLGNYVINTARFFKNKQKPTSNLMAKKRMRKQMTASLMTHCLKLGANAEREGLDAFREYMERLKAAERAVGGGKDKEQQHEIEMD
jgi:hypothetical protein